MQATHIATLTGRIIGYIFIAGGIIFMFITSQIFTSYQWITGLWLAFIGWFLEIAASISYRQASLHNVFNNYTIRDLMITDYPIISQELNLERLVHDHKPEDLESLGIRVADALNEETPEKISLFALLRAMGDPKVRRGLYRSLNLLKAIGD